jgi:hypothetical protein
MSASFQYRSLEISWFSLKVALLWETLATVQNFMLSGKYFSGNDDDDDNNNSIL